MRGGVWRRRADRRHDVDEEGGQLVQVMENNTILPHDNGKEERAIAKVE